MCLTLALPTSGTAAANTGVFPVTIRVAFLNGLGIVRITSLIAWFAQARSGCAAGVRRTGYRSGPVAAGIAGLDSVTARWVTARGTSGTCALSVAAGGIRRARDRTCPAAAGIAGLDAPRRVTPRVALRAEAITVLAGSAIGAGR